VLQALDLELGRLLDSLDPALLARTTVIVVGDNGTTDHVVHDTLDPDRQKTTVYEGGVHVPMIVTGPHVASPGSVSEALVHVADVFPTVAEIAGVPLIGTDESLSVDGDDGPVALDGRSLLPLLADPQASGPDHVFVEAFSPNGPGPHRHDDRRAVIEARFKLMRQGGAEHLFDLGAGTTADPDGPDLLEAPLDDEAASALARLACLLDGFEQTVRFEGR
jgi:arylsulfatase A-like enzyme